MFKQKVVAHACAWVGGKAADVVEFVERKAGQVAVVAGVALAPMVSHAQGTTPTTFDPTTYVAAIVATVAGILAVSGAVFGVRVALKSGKWAQRAL